MSLPDHCTHDVVLDACVLNHSCHEWGILADSSTAVLESLQRHDSMQWALDDTGGAAPALQTSRMVAEYMPCVGPQSFPLALLQHFASSGRVSFIDRPSEADARTIKRLVPKNKGDQVALATALGSLDRTLITNDDQDFPEARRDQIRQRLTVRVLYSWEAA